MKAILPYLFEKLKQQILEHSGLTVTSPGDCKYLSYLITAKTKKQISETTLKRIYGFTASKVSPSLYTLNILAEYCEHIGWDSFCDQKTADGCKENVHAGSELNSVPDSIGKTSRLTLRTLISRSGVPYRLTIKRRFIEEHLEMFSHAPQVATILTAPTGYGKTIGLCHWVEEQLSAIAARGSEDTLLYLSSSVPSGQSYGNDINDWLSRFIRISAAHDEIGSSRGENQLLDKKFYLIIDGFDEEKFKPADYEMLSDRLIDLITLNRNQSNFKLVLSMRSASWVNFRNRLFIANLREDLFSGFMSDTTLENNMILFSTDEIKELCSNVNPVVTSIHPLNHEVVSLFSYPLFFQYYYQKHTTDFCLSNLDYLSMYEVISSYFLDKIYTSRFSSEKVLLLRTLLIEGELKDGNFVVDKFKIYEQIKALQEAYHDLISIGFLEEINRSKETGYAKYIEFPNKSLLTFCMARKLIYDSNEFYDEVLIERFNHLQESAYRLDVLKWCFFNAIKAKHYAIFKHLKLVPLSPSEKASLLKFLINLVRHTCAEIGGNESAARFFADEQENLLHYFLGIEFISPEYEDILRSLLSLDLKTKSRIQVYICLAAIGIVQLNSKAVEECITALQGVPLEVLRTFPVNPLYCIEAIYNYFKHGIVKKEALRQITHFCFNPPLLDTGDKREAGCNDVLYLLGASTLGIGGNKRKLLRYINVLEKLLTGHNDIHLAFYFFLMITKADSYLSLGMISEGRAVYEAITRKYDAIKSPYTSYMEICSDMVKAKVLALSGKYEESQFTVEKIMYLSANSKFHYIEVNILSSYIETQMNRSSPEIMKEFYYRFIMLIRKSTFEPRSFLLNYEKIYGFLFKKAAS